MTSPSSKKKKTHEQFEGSQYTPEKKQKGGQWVGGVALCRDGYRGPTGRLISKKRAKMASLTLIKWNGGVNDLSGETAARQERWMANGGERGVGGQCCGQSGILSPR